MESTYFPHPSQDQINEATQEESEADILAHTAARAIKLAEETIAAANDAHRAAKEAVQQQLATEKASDQNAAQEVQH